LSTQMQRVRLKRGKTQVPHPSGGKNRRHGQYRPNRVLRGGPRDERDPHTSIGGEVRMGVP
jgi:hypothetical protein